MHRVTFGLAATVAGLVLAPNLASALSAVTTGSTNLRAGPAFDFPVVDQIPSDVTVNVHGCIRGYRWCDVSWRDARGWVPGQELAYLYQGRRVTVVEYGPRIGFPVVGFAFDRYWDRYYRGRSWYGERTHWRSVWRERERNEGSVSGRADERRGGRTGSRQETYGRQGDESAPGMDRRGNRNERPDVRTGRGDWRDRGESRGYGPQISPPPRQDTDRGMRTNPDRGMNPGAGDRGPGGQRGFDRGGPGQGERRP